MRLAWSAGVLLATLSVVVGRRTDAQERGTVQDRASYGVISGIAADSLGGGALSNAFLVVEGTSSTATSDSVGGFLIDSVLPGRHRVVLFHHLLDVIRFSVRTEEMVVTAGDTIRLILATPSPETVVARMCGTANPDDPAGLAGIVTDAHGKPVGEATVMLAWTQIRVGRDIGVRQVAQRRAGTTFPDGTFRICGLPTDLAADTRVAYGTDTSGTIPVRLESAVLAIVEIALPGDDVEVVADAPIVTDSLGGTPVDSRGVARRGSALVRGRIANRGGTGIPGARVWITGAVGAALTDSSGAFVLAEQPSGSQTLLVRRIGYEMRELPLILRPREPLDLHIALDDYVPLLPEVVVRATRDFALDRVGFVSRERVGAGFYVRPEEIERRNASRVSDYLQNAPMLHVAGTGSGRHITGKQRGFEVGGCVVYAIDGQRWTGPAVDDFLNPQEIAAIEVYSRGQTPALFLGVDQCESVLIWTKNHLGLK